MLSTHIQSSHWDSRVSAQHFKPNEKFINMLNRPTSSMPINESELVNDCRRGLLDGRVRKPMDYVRMLCLSRGASGIYNLGRSFRRMADHGDGLRLSGFMKGLADVKMNCTDEEATKIFRSFDNDGKREIDMKDFLHKLRDLSPAREDIIHKCFKMVDIDDDDVITVAELSRTYSVQHHPMYMSGEEDRKNIITRFLATFEEGDNPSAKITYEEFLNYYAGISAMIEDDGYFNLLLREEYSIN